MVLGFWCNYVLWHKNISPGFPLRNVALILQNNHYSVQLIKVTWSTVGLYAVVRSGYVKGISQHKDVLHCSHYSHDINNWSMYVLQVGLQILWEENSGHIQILSHSRLIDASSHTSTLNRILVSLLICSLLNTFSCSVPHYLLPINAKPHLYANLTILASWYFNSSYLFEWLNYVYSASVEAKFG